MADTAPLVQAQGLSKTYRVSRGWMQPAATVAALSGMSFELAAGQTLAVVGESGCGKSTLARALTLVEAPDAGTLQLGGMEVTTADTAQRRALRAQVQMVFQNPYASLNPRKRIQQALDEPLKLNTPLNAAQRHDRLQAMLARVGLAPEHAQRYPHMFSGGQRQRVAIARAMILNPKLLVADEPTSALDVSIQAQILNLFMDLQRDTGVACVFISHNLSVVEHIADRVMVMYLGRAVELAPKARLFAQPLHPYTQALLSATPSLHAEKRVHKLRLPGEPPSALAPPNGCAFHPRCPRASEMCRVQRPVLLPQATAEGHAVACHHPGVA
ncbi:oligopeptide/dipeptide ABC transporter, ATP-binding protein [Burkholderiales bacterium JOSHI_001]|nr:oligopeptide/dipeptide ABC transporter, ATP-binding protein [Burkholderiales bacterium JOSHI_001]